MKKIIVAAVTLACTSAFAQGPHAMPGPAKGGADRVLLVAPDKMPLPPPPGQLHQLQRSAMIKAEDGFSTVKKSPEQVCKFMNELAVIKGRQSTAAEAAAFVETVKSGKPIPTTPIVVNSAGDLKVGFHAVAVRSGKLIGATPQGTIINGKWTGIERYFHIEGSGYWRVSETDLAASGGMFYLNKAAVNTTVAGKPAISIVLTDDQGQRLEEVLWVNGGTLYKVTYAPDQHAGHDGKKINSAISAVSLAAELQ
ncbi:hypothetical protein [Massilia sp. CCM 8734]|uniref:hypothetical protein n=1 Tax=Massilia sp. CCM 8734 TaxID=2609283 RepID=UPI001421EB79|nr:hypothetical protein [Massilia sp. CCM 8734]NIA00248.1 hypothetical protein [Massilia sp. CCM 8734]